MKHISILCVPGLDVKKSWCWCGPDLVLDPAKILLAGPGGGGTLFPPGLCRLQTAKRGKVEPRAPLNRITVSYPLEVTG